MFCFVKSWPCSTLIVISHITVDRFNIGIKLASLVMINLMPYLIHKRSQALLTELYFATPGGHNNGNLMHLAVKCTKLLDISDDYLCSLELWVCL